MDRYRMLPSYHFYEVEGNSPLTLDKSVGKPLRDYKIYGNTVQNGIPTPEEPIEVQGVGDLITDETDPHFGKYKIPIEVRSYAYYANIQLEEGTTATEYEPYKETIVTDLYLNEPLYKIGNYADYIDFMNKKIVRNVVKIKLSNNFNRYNDLIWQSNTGFILLKTVKELCTHFIQPATSQELGISNKNAQGIYITVSAVTNKMGLTLAEFNDWLSQNNVYYYAVLATPVEENVEVPPTLTHTGLNIIEVNTTVNPSNTQIQYYK